MYKNIQVLIGLVLSFLLLQISSISAQTKLMDEDFDDWTSTELVYSDEIGDGRTNSIDFKDMYLTDDETNIYIRIQVSREIELQEFDDLVLYIDIDDNVNTGLGVQGFGADFAYGFGDRNGVVKVGNNFYDIFHNDIDLISLPTVSADEFEISISKTIDIFQGEVDMSNRIRLAFVDTGFGGDRLPNQGSILHTMTNDAFSPPPYSLDKSLDSDLRIVSYNALRDAIFEDDSQPSFRRILRAIVPDILCVQEVYDHSSLELSQLMEVFLPSAMNDFWYHAAVSPDILVASRYPIVASASSDGNGIFEIDTDDGKIIIVNAHLPCCGNEFDRQREIDRLLSFLRNSIDGLTNISIPNETPIFVLGDMNLVGLAQQQFSLVTGDIQAEYLFGPDFNPDYDGSTFVDNKPVVTGQSNTSTWYNPSGSFSAGRLDYLLHTASVAEVKNSFALNTAFLTDAERAQYGLRPDDTYDASDHFPCVMDVDLHPVSSVSVSGSQASQVLLYPNPVRDELKISISQEVSNGFVEAVIRDLQARVVRTTQLNLSDVNEFSLDLNGLAEGMYFLDLNFEDNRISKKFIRVD